MHRRLGQHFLRPGRTVRSIASSLDEVGESVVVEIGAGKGVLTAPLLEHYSRVVVVEKTPRLSLFFRNVFPLKSPLVHLPLLPLMCVMRSGAKRSPQPPTLLLQISPSISLALF